MKQVLKRRPSERGSTAVIVGIMIAVLVGFTGLGVDVGNLVYMKMRLQNSADAAAVAAIRDIDNRALLVDSMVVNGNFNPDTLEVYDVKRGDWDPDAKVFTVNEVDGSAVRVGLGEDVPLHFISVLPGVPSKLTVNARATANFQIAGAVVKLGATAIDINTDEGALLKGLLGNLLGTTLNLSAVGWEGILNAKLDLVKFIDLAKVELGVGTADGVLSSNLTLAGIVDLMIEALQADTTTLDLEAIAGLTQLKLDVDPLTLELPLGDLLQLDTNKGSLAKADINVLSMITAAAELFNHESAVSVDNTSLHLGVADVDLKVKVSESPVIRIVTMDDPDIHSAGARVYLNASVLGNVVNLPLYLELGSGTATLTDITESAVDLETTTSLAKIYLGDINPDYFYNTAASLDESDFTPVTVLNLLGLLSLDAKAYGDAEGGEGLISVTPDEFGITQHVSGALGSATGGLFESLFDNLYVQAGSQSLLGPLLAPVLNPLLQLLGLSVGDTGNTNQGLVSAILSALVAPLLESLLDPVSALTGVHPGRTDVTVYDYAYEAALVE